MDKGLLQKDVALELAVCEDSITGWENGRSSPVLHHYPAIIAFLGYYPFAHERESIAGKLQQWRFCQGLSHIDCGTRLKADSRNVRDWERRKKEPSVKRAQQIIELWSQLPQQYRSE
jgi:DNA-binding transcriptional regulator YiaG